MELPAAAPAPLVLASGIGDSAGSLTIAAAAGVAAAGNGGQPVAVLLVEIGAQRPRRPDAACLKRRQSARGAVAAAGFDPAARGRLCWLALPSDEDPLAELARVVAPASGAGWSSLDLPVGFSTGAIADRRLRARGGLLHAELPAARSLAALAVRELRAAVVCAPGWPPGAWGAWAAGGRWQVSSRAAPPALAPAVSRAGCSPTVARRCP